MLVLRRFRCVVLMKSIFLETRLSTHNVCIVNQRNEKVRHTFIFRIYCRCMYIVSNHIIMHVCVSFSWNRDGIYTKGISGATTK